MVCCMRVQNEMVNKQTARVCRTFELISNGRRRNVCRTFVWRETLIPNWIFSANNDAYPATHPCMQHKYTFQIENQSSLCKCMVCDVYLRLFSLRMKMKINFYHSLIFLSQSRIFLGTIFSFSFHLSSVLYLFELLLLLLLFVCIQCHLFFFFFHSITISFVVRIARKLFIITPVLNLIDFYLAIETYIIIIFWYINLNIFIACFFYAKVFPFYVVRRLHWPLRFHEHFNSDFGKLSVPNVSTVN